MKVPRLMIQTIAILFGLSFFIGSILLINTLVTVPGTPISYYPAALFSNFIFAMELGFSLPYPQFLGPILWLFITWLWYYLVYRILNYLFT